MLSLHTLGELKLIDAAGRELLAGRRKELVLLAYVARRRPRVLQRAELAALLWGERPELNARASLRQAILHLKRAIGTALHLDGESVTVDDTLVILDLTAFEAALASKRFAEAVALWRGDFLTAAEDIGGESCRLWIEEERERLRKRLAWAFEQLVEDASRRGDHAAAANWAEQWTQALPTDERAHLQSIAALRMAGRLGDARAQHAAFRARHRDTFGCEPSPSFLRLEAELETAVAVAPAPAGYDAIGAGARDAPLVGRRHTMVEVAQAWSLADGGAGGVVLIEGDEGLGKTRFADEVVRTTLLRNRDVLVLQSAGTGDVRQAGNGEGEGEGKGESWSTLRAVFARTVDAPGLIGVSADTLAELTRLVPSLREQFTRLPTASSDEFALRNAVVQAVAAIASEVPVLIVVDDADRADAASARALVALASAIGRLRALLVLTARPVRPEHETSGEITTLRSALARVARVRCLTLSALDLDDTAALVASLASIGSSQVAALASRLHDQMEGNPRFIIDALTVLANEGGHISSSILDKPLPVPASLRAAVTRRLARVTPEARALAEMMAASHGPIDLETVARVRRLSTSSAHAVMGELISQHLVTRTGGEERDGRYAFVHDTARRAIALALPVERRLEARRRRTVATLAGAVLLVALVVGGIVWTVTSVRGARVPNGALAVGLIRDYAAPDSGIGGALADMLATNLARVPGLRVLSNARMLEAMNELRRGGTASPDAAATRELILEAARSVGANDIIEGELYRDGPTALRLDVRRIDLRTGVVRDGTTVQGANVFELVDQATARLAQSDRSEGEGDRLRIADVTTNSLTAYRFYEEGLKAYYVEGNLAAAHRLFQAASREDSTFAMAAYYNAQVAGGGPGEGWSEYARADRLADRASDRERLLIRASWAFERNDPVAAAYAETLSVRFPTEPEGLQLIATIKTWDGDFLGAVRVARRVLAMDSATLHSRLARSSNRESSAPTESEVRCLSCQALSQIAQFYWMADSMDAAVRALQENVRLQPSSPGAWILLAWMYQYAERYPEALDAYQQGHELGAAANYPDAVSFYLTSAIRTGDFGAVNTTLGQTLQSDPWTAAISLRQQGRLREALAQARAQRREEERGDPTHQIRFDGSIMEALVLMEMGRGREAAAHFDTIAWRAAPTGEVMRHRAARHRAWMLTHAASALASVGDTALLPRLADSIEALGRMSAYGRDRRLHHHVRGLLYVARGELERAVSEFRLAVYSWTLGYTRTNLELGRTLLALQRPREAIDALRPALHGSLDASPMYVTRTEIQEELARAFEAAGQNDSARVYYARVARAWTHADRQFADRQRAASRRAAALTRLRFEAAHPERSVGNDGVRRIPRVN